MVDVLPTPENAPQGPGLNPSRQIELLRGAFDLAEETWARRSRLYRRAMVYSFLLGFALASTIAVVAVTLAGA